jgi:O-antigen/teichoic acid export membrane protein
VSLGPRLRRWIATGARSKAVRDAVVYAGANAATAAVPFFLLPVLTRHLDTTGYGTVALFTVIVALAQPVVSLSLSGAVTTRFYGFPDRAEVASFVTLCLALSMAVGAALLVATPLVAPLTERWLDLPASIYPDVVGVAGGQSVVLVLLALLQAERRPLAYGVVQFTQSAMNGLLSVALVVNAHAGWVGRVRAQTITNVSFMVIALVLLHRGGWIRFRLRREHLDYALRHGLPLIPHAFAGWLVTQVDRVFLVRGPGVATVGLYAAAFQLASVVGFFADAANRATQPWVYERLASGTEDDARAVVRFAYGGFGACLAAGAAFVAACVWVVPFLLGPEYRGARPLLLPLVLGFVFNAMYYLPVNPLFYANFTAPIAACTVATAALHVGLNFALVPRWGGQGAAWSFAATLFVTFVLVWAVSARLVPLPWRAPLRSAASRARAAR